MEFCFLRSYKDEKLHFRKLLKKISKKDSTVEFYCDSFTSSVSQIMSIYRNDESDGVLIAVRLDFFKISDNIEHDILHSS